MLRRSSEHNQVYKSKIRGLLSQNAKITRRELQLEAQRN
jgi:hypothetical protein